MYFSRLIRFASVALFAGATVCAAVSPASADEPGRHPAYIHGLRDLQAAHSFLDRRGNARVNGREVRALRDVDVAYRFALRAAERDQKNIHAFEPIDANLHHRDRLVRALSALQAAHRDFSAYESDGRAYGWQRNAIVYVDRAIRETRHALRDQHWDMGY